MRAQGLRCSWFPLLALQWRGTLAAHRGRPVEDTLRFETSNRNILSEDIASGSCKSRGGVESTWRPAAEQPWPASENACASGKLLPTVYVLGAPKAATTSLAADLTFGAGLKCSGGEKEWHFWFAHTVNEFAAEPHGEVYDQWMSGLPRCSTTERQVGGDFSPSNLRIVPAGRRNKQPMHLRTKDDFDTAGRTESLPLTLASLYGGVAGKITFVVMLREPLSRIHSHWFYERLYETVPDMDFQEGVEGMMTRNGNELVWMSMYGQQLTEWVSAFSPEQFYVIPYLAYGSGSSNEIIRDLSQRIKFDMVNEDGTVAHRNKNTHQRPPLEELVTPDFRARFDDYMAEDKAKLLQVFSEGHPKGMGLAKYSGKAGDQDEIDAWLQTWW